MSLRFTFRLVFCFVLCLSWGTRVFAQQDRFDFSESENASRAQATYFENILKLRKEFDVKVDDADNRFIKSSERYIERYAGMIEREVRSLTRLGKIDEASQLAAASRKIVELDILPPDAQGSHFLNTISLEIPGNEQATKYGLDLRVEIEKLGVAHAKQVQIAGQQYCEQALDTRKFHIELLKRILVNEQFAGRINAVQQIQAAVEKLSDMQTVEPPKIESHVPEKDPVSQTDTNTQTDPDQSQPEQSEPGPSQTEKQPGTPTQTTTDTVTDSQSPSKVKIFDLGPEDIGQPKADDSNRLRYYLIQYKRSHNDNVSYVVSLGDRGGKLLDVYWPDIKDGKREHANLPIDVQRSGDRVTLKHSLSEGGGMIVQELVLKEGRIDSCRQWMSYTAYDNRYNPDSSGTIKPLGSPGADLLGWADGVYAMNLQMHKTKKDQHASGPIQFEFEVKNGYVILTRVNRSKNANQWSKYYNFIMQVQTDGKKLIMTYDKDAYGWADVFVLDFSTDQPTMSHWWEKSWYDNGQRASNSGVMVKSDGK